MREFANVISAPRFATYLQAKGNDKAGALALYHWNLDVSSAFIVPLQICEVAIRNGIVEVLEKVHGPNWPWSNGFIRSLPEPKVVHHYNPKIDLRNVANKQPTAGKVVAELKFAFWGKIFTAGQDSRLWINHFNDAFPGFSRETPIPVARATAFEALESVRKLRNRIAHHEPIFSRDITAEYVRLHTMISWRSPIVAAWVDKAQRVTELIPNKP